MMARNRQHFVWVDAMRIVGCLGVLLTHCVYNNGSGGNELIALIDFYGIAGFMLFFMLSGIFAFSDERPLGAVLRSKFRRIVIPLVSWSVVYLLLYAFTGRLSWGEFPYRLLQMPFKPQIPQFWYLYIVLGAYLLSPILSQWLSHATARQVRFYLLLWVATLFVPLVCHFWPDGSMIIDYFHGVLFYYQGFLGIMLLGYYLQRFVSFRRIPLWLWILGALLLLAPVLYPLTKLPFNLFNRYLSPTMVALTAVMFVVLRQVNWPSCWHRALRWIGGNTYGVYLMHMIVIKFIAWPVIEPLRLNYWLGIPLILLITLAIGLPLTSLLSHSRLSWLVGSDNLRKRQ